MEFERTNETLTLSSQSSFTATLLGLRSWQKAGCEEGCVGWGGGQNEEYRETEVREKRLTLWTRPAEWMYWGRWGKERRQKETEVNSAAQHIKTLTKGRLLLRTPWQPARPNSCPTNRQRCIDEWSCSLLR